MKMIIELLAIATAASVFNTASAVPRYSSDMAPGLADSGWVQESKRYKCGSDEFQHFSLDMPMVSFKYKGVEYSVGGASVSVIAKWGDYLKNDGVRDYDTIGTYSRDYLNEGYQLKLNNFIKPKIIRMLAEVNVPSTVRHEVMHFLVDQKYRNYLDGMSYADCHFIHEMLAHMSEGISETEALRRVEENYPKLSDAIRDFKVEKSKNRLKAAQKLLRKPNSADTAGSKKNAQGDKTDSDFDCCKCENPDDRDFRCTKCGKMSKWLAPHRDKEFEQWLKKKK